MNQQNQPSIVKVTGAWIDPQADPQIDQNPMSKEPDTDLSYWSTLSESYEPEWFPLGVKLPHAA